ncbi:MAG TPA: PKD domain-containing protein [Thermoplasmata archaeon]|nr:PKD domain-containing protein [Thermoplasmata archaeon]
MFGGGATAATIHPAVGRSKGARWVPVLALVLLLSAGAVVVVGSVVSTAPAAPRSDAPTLPGPHALAWGHVPSHRDCDGMYWSSWYNASYSPSYCYGHDEPTMSYVSNALGSGEDAQFQMTLPADGPTYAQGDLYATFWFGGTVYDTASTGGSSQAFLEVQFYPAPPLYTGTGSGPKDCLPDGSFNANFSAGTNDWFACGIVWQLAYIGGYLYENAAYAQPLDAGSTNAILVMHSSDRVFVNYSGVAQSARTPWNISISDATTGLSGLLSLKNGSLVLSPYYSTAASGNTLSWGASNPGAIAFAYEVGHTYNLSSFYCYPGDGVCGSYFPGRWAGAGQMHLSLPTVGAPGSTTYPEWIALSSSQGGSAEVNASSGCGAESFSTSKDCMYPFYQYRAASQDFTFGTTPVLNDTHDYGNEYQFPSSISSRGQWSARTPHAPWGSVRFTVYPTNATVSFSRPGQSTPVLFGSNRNASFEFLEGAYWFNVSARGCTGTSSSVYVEAGAQDYFPVVLHCTGSTLTARVSVSPASGVAPLPVNFTGTAAGGTAPYQYLWNFGDGSSSSARTPAHIYSSPGPYAVELIVGDANGSGALASLVVNVSTPSCAGLVFHDPIGSSVRDCHLNRTQSAIWIFNVTKTDWWSNGWVDVWERDGSTSGASPVFRMGAGMAGTPSLAHAKQKKAGPNAFIQIPLFTQAANRYGGWGTYWVIVTAPGGSGGFCFQLQWSNVGPSGTPACSTNVASPPPAPTPPARANGVHAPVPRIALPTPPPERVLVAVSTALVPVAAATRGPELPRRSG